MSMSLLAVSLLMFADRLPSTLNTDFSPILSGKEMRLEGLGFQRHTWTEKGSTTHSLPRGTRVQVQFDDWEDEDSPAGWRRVKVVVKGGKKDGEVYWVLRGSLRNR
jgi:hypothetical protein